MKLVVTMYIYVEVYFLQKNQTLMNDWGNSITMSMRQYSDL
jgi:hypothetical protein